MVLGKIKRKLFSVPGVMFLVFPYKKQRLMNKIKAVESAFAKASGSTVGEA